MKRVYLKIKLTPIFFRAVEEIVGLGIHHFLLLIQFVEKTLNNFAPCLKTDSICRVV
jgi:hypothetical protein